MSHKRVGVGMGVCGAEREGGMVVCGGWGVEVAIVFRAFTQNISLTF